MAERHELARPLVVWNEPLLPIQATPYLQKVSGDGRAALDDIRQGIDAYLQERMAAHRGRPAHEVKRAWEQYDGQHGPDRAPPPPGLPPGELPTLEIYDVLLSGTVRGTKVRAIPLRDDPMYIPEQKSAGAKGAEGKESRWDVLRVTSRLLLQSAASCRDVIA